MRDWREVGVVGYYKLDVDTGGGRWWLVLDFVWWNKRILCNPNRCSRKSSSSVMIRWY